MSNIFYKAPGALLDYVINWSDVIGQGGAITSVTWTVPTGIISVSTDTQGANTIIKLSGGLPGADYQIACAIETASGLKDGRSILIKVWSPAQLERIAQLRRMVNEPTAATYEDGALHDVIMRYAANGGYDIHAAAASIWEEKAAKLVDCFDFSTDTGRFNRSGKFQQHMQQARYHAARRMVRGIALGVDTGAASANE